MAVGPSDFWTSRDGRQWDAITPGGLDEATLVNLIGIPDGSMLAFGYVPNPGSLGSEPRTWISADAQSWEAIDLGFPTDYGVTAAAAGARGIVLVLGRQQIWFSADGLTWRLTHEANDEQAFEAIGAGPEGFVAVGQQGRLSLRYRSVVVASSDGVSWIEAPAEEGVLSTTPSLWAVAPIGSNWLAAPVPVDGEAMVLHSANGLDWTSAASISTGDPMEGLVPILRGDGRMSFLHVPSGDERHLALVWASSEGVNWRPLDLRAPGQGAFDVASNGATTVILAISAPEGQSRAEFWVATTTR